MGHRVTVNLEECPENKTYQDLQPASRWFPLSVCGGEQIGPLRGLSDNKHLQTGLFACAFGGIAEQ